jgi:hypothetical protein
MLFGEQFFKMALVLTVVFGGLSQFLDSVPEDRFPLRLFIHSFFIYIVCYAPFVEHTVPMCLIEYVNILFSFFLHSFPAHFLSACAPVLVQT